ncbi:hypothetical protein BDW60DRAFT_176623 [Aspergillus nidulans var. acristatus]
MGVTSPQLSLSSHCSVNRLKRFNNALPPNSLSYWMANMSLIVGVGKAVMVSVPLLYCSLSTYVYRWIIK